MYNYTVDFSVATAETSRNMQEESRLHLNVVIRDHTFILEQLTEKDESQLISGNAFLVLNFGLDVLYRVGTLDVEGDCLAGESLNENLHFALFVLVLINNSRLGPEFIIFDIPI